MKMAELQSGVLVRLLTSMNRKQKPSEKQKPTLLQIRSIMPVMEDGDLWPNKGFFLKVSDASHAIYASLPPEQDDLILSNKLQLGQLLYVDCLESGYPVPFLKGVKPVAGRHRCVGNPEDLVSLDFLLKFREKVGSNQVVKNIHCDVVEDKRRHSMCPSAVRSNESKRKNWNTLEFKRNGDVSDFPILKSNLEVRRNGDDSDSSVLGSTLSERKHPCVSLLSFCFHVL